MGYKVKVNKIPNFPPPGVLPEAWGQGVPETTQTFFEGSYRVPPIRSTPLAVLDECPRKFLYAFKLGIQPKVTERPLTVGTITHLVLKGLYTGKTEEASLALSDTALKRCSDKIIAVADGAGLLPSGQDLKSTLEDLQEDFHKARAMAMCFWRFSPFDTAKWEVLLAPDGTPLVEVVLETSIRGLTRPLYCPCDLALIHKETGEVWIVDFKTTSFDPRVRAIPTRISPQLALYRLSLQCHLDAWAAQGLMPQRTVVGSIHAIIKKPTIKLCGKDEKNAVEWNCTPFEAYIRRLVEWYRGVEAENTSNPPIVQDSNRFTRPVMTRELWGRLTRYCKMAAQPPNFDTFYRAGESVCLKFNRPCPYMLLCNSDPAMIPDLVRSHFTIGFREDEEAQDV